MPEARKLEATAATTSVALVLFCGLQALVLLQVILAHMDSFLTVAEMQRRGTRQGLPLVWHLGIWSDFLLVSPLVGLVVVRYARQWSRTAILSALALGLSVTLALGWLYALSDLPQSHVHAHQTTPAGYAHLAYTWVGLAVFLLLYFFTPSLSPAFATWTSLLLVLHVSVASHLPLAVLAYTIRLPWYPREPLSDPTPWIQVAAVACLLASRTLHMAHGGRAPAAESTEAPFPDPRHG